MRRICYFWFSAFGLNFLASVNPPSPPPAEQSSSLTRSAVCCTAVASCMNNSWQPLILSTASLHRYGIPTPNTEWKEELRLIRVESSVVHSRRTHILLLCVSVLLQQFSNKTRRRDRPRTGKQRKNKITTESWYFVQTCRIILYVSTKKRKRAVRISESWYHTADGCCRYTSI